MSIKTCKIDNCDNPVIAKQLCSKHYKRLAKHDDTSVNFKAYYKWRKKERLESLIEPEFDRLSHDESVCLQELFDECVSRDEFSKSYVGSSISSSLDLAWHYSKDFTVEYEPEETIDFSSHRFDESCNSGFTKQELEEIFNL